MRRFFTAFVTVLLLSGALSASASAADPVIYQTARAIPTKSGEFVKITVYAKHVKRIKIRVNGELPWHHAKRFGTGCGKKNCSKWRIHVRRTPDDECYDLAAIGYRGDESTSLSHTVCEPFPDGSV